MKKGRTEHERYEEAYQERPDVVKRREARNLARAHETKRLGHNPAGDVAHITPLSRRGKPEGSNIKIESVAKNRGWRKGRSGYSVPTDK